MSRTHALARACAAFVTLACAAALALLALAPGVGLAAEEEEAGALGHAQDGSATYYGTMEAWSAALTGTTVVMDCDWYLTRPLVVLEGRSVTIMMNGHKIYRGGYIADDGAVIRMDKNSTLTLDGSGAWTTFTFRKFAASYETTLTSGGLVTGGYSRETAGGVYMQEGATLNLVQVAVSGNYTYEPGGAVEMDGDNCALNMTDAIISYNKAVSGSVMFGRGGGVWAGGDNCSITMTRSSISNNEAEFGGGVYSGGTYTKLTMKDHSYIESNRAIDTPNSTLTKGYGGGVHFNYTDFTLEGDGTSSISGNVADKDGGGIYIDSHAASTNKGSISDIILRKNTAEDGGGIYVDQENVTIENCVFSENGSTESGEGDQGGALYINNDNTTVKGCTFTRNRCEDEGGAIYNNTDGTLIQDCTIENNTTGSEGGGIWTSCYNDMKLSGKVVVRGNARTDGAADDVFLNSNTGNTVRAYLKGDVSAGSYVGIRTGIEGERVVVEDLSTYIEGTFFLDQGGAYHLSYSAADKKLSQVSGGLRYLVTVNGQGETRYAQGDTVTLDAGSYGDWKSFQRWDVSSSTGLWNISDVASVPNRTITFTMPGNDVHLVAVFGEQGVYQTSVRIDVDAPEPGQELPTTGTLTYTATDGSEATAQVSVAWYEITDTWEMIPAEGVAKYSTTYGPEICASRNAETGLAFWTGMGKDDVDLRVGAAQESSCTQASVDAETGTLTAYGQMLTTRGMGVASIESLALTVPAGTSLEELVAAMPTTAAGLAEDGAAVTLTLQVASEVDWAGLGVLGSDGKVAEPEGASATFEVPLAVLSCSDDSLEVPEALGAATVTLTVTHTPLTVSFDAAGGSNEPAAQAVAYGACAQEPEEPSYAGQAFLGWFADGADEAWDFAAPVTEDVALTARWQAVFEVMFEPANGGDVFIQQVVGGACAQSPEQPALEGYAFLGWFADGSDEAWDFETPVAGDMTLTARWRFVAPYRFADVAEGTWFYDWVYQACGLGLMTGYRDGMGISTGLFGPGDVLTRGQVATVLWRISGSPTAGDGGSLYSFPDVPEGCWCSQAVYWCAERGIVTGYMAGEHKGSFMPDAPVTREELAVMVYRFEREAGAMTDGVPGANFDRCPDNGDVSDWAAEAVRWCAAAGVLTGVQEKGADGSVTYWLAPGETTTRAQAAKVFCLAWTIRWSSGESPYEPVAQSQAEQQDAQAEAQASDASETVAFDDVTFEDAVAALDAAQATQPAEESQGAEAVAPAAPSAEEPAFAAPSDSAEASGADAPGEAGSFAGTDEQDFDEPGLAAQSLAA